jgi:hypothetical protein
MSATRGPVTPAHGIRHGTRDRGAGHGSVQSGDRLHFQAWFRDSDPLAHGTVNFSDGVEVEFQ